MSGENFVDVLRKYMTDHERKRMNDWIYVFLKSNNYEKTCQKLEQVQSLFPMNLVKLPDGKDNRLVKKWKVACDLEFQISKLKSDIHDRLFEKNFPKEKSPFYPASIPLNKKKCEIELVVSEPPSSTDRDDDEEEVKGHCREVTCYAHHPSKPVILTGAQDCGVRDSVRLGKISVWDYESGSLEYKDSVSNIPIRVTSIEFNDFGDRIAVGVGDFSIYIYSYPLLQLKISFSPENHNISSFEFSYPYLFSGSEAGVVRMYNIENQKLVHTFNKPREGGFGGGLRFGGASRRQRRSSSIMRSGTFGRVSCLDSVIDERGDTDELYFALAGGDRYAYILSRRTKEVVSKLQHGSAVSFVRFLPKISNRIISNSYDFPMTAFDIETASGEFAISAGCSDSHIMVWAARSGKVLAKFEDPQGTISPIDCFLIEGGRYFVVLYLGYDMVVFDLSNGSVVKRISVEISVTTNPPLGICMGEKLNTLVQVDSKNIRLYECF